MRTTANKHLKTSKKVTGLIFNKTFKLMADDLSRDQWESPIYNQPVTG